MYGSVTYVLAIHPLLTIDLEVPGKSGFEVSLVLGVVEVELLVRVGFPIRSNVNDGLDVLTTGDQNTRNDGVVGGTKNTDGTEEVFARSLETVEETTDLVRGHEGLGELLIVLEVDTPVGEALLVEANFVKNVTMSIQLFVKGIASELTSGRTTRSNHRLHEYPCWSRHVSSPQG